MVLSVWDTNLVEGSGGKVAVPKWLLGHCDGGIVVCFEQQWKAVEKLGIVVFAETFVLVH